MSLFLRVCFAALACGGVGVCLACPAFAQSGDAKSGDKPPPAQPADAAKEAQRQIDEFAEAARVVTGPAGNPECVWLGRRVVGLLWRDDMDTAFRHLDLYDRFGCPGPHIQATFRCVVRQGNIDPKAPQSLNARVHACWLNPAHRPPPQRQPRASSPGGTGRRPPSRRPEPPASNARWMRVGTGRAPSSIRHDLGIIVTWSHMRYAASQQSPTQGTGWRQKS